MQYKDYVYAPYEDVEYGDEGPENVKIFHFVKTPDGKEVSMDWSPYSTPSLEDFKLWIDLSMPDRTTVRNFGGPLDHKDLLALQEARRAA